MNAKVNLRLKFSMNSATECLLRTLASLGLLQWLREIWVQFLGQEDPLEKRMATTPVFLPGESHRQRNLVGYSLWSPKELDPTEQLTFLLFTFPTHRLGMVFLKMLIMPAL